MYCSQCGTLLQSEERFCHNCGQPVDETTPSSRTSEQGTEDSFHSSTYDQEQSWAFYGQPNAPSNQEESLEDEMLLRELVGNNSIYYVKDFKRIERGEHARFNWCAFLFGPFFFGYRKCYNLLLKISLPILLANVIVCIVLGSLLLKFISSPTFDFSFYSSYSLLSLLTGLAMLIIQIVVGFKFNKLYYNRLRRIIDREGIRETDFDSPTTFSIIMKRGGVSGPILAALIVTAFLCSIVLTIVIFAPSASYLGSNPEAVDEFAKNYDSYYYDEYGASWYASDPWPYSLSDYCINGYEVDEDDVSDVREGYALDTLKEYPLDEPDEFTGVSYIIEADDGKTVYSFAPYGDEDVEDYELYGITTTSPSAVGPREIAIGDTLESVLKKFPTKGADHEFIYYIEDEDGETVYTATQMEEDGEEILNFGEGYIDSEYYYVLTLTFEGGKLKSMSII